jgi:hypothetical protein
VIRDVCGSSRWERDRALKLERRWKVKVEEFETYGLTALALMSQCQRSPNRAGIIDNGCTHLGGGLGLARAALALGVMRDGGVVRHLSYYHMSAHSPRQRFDSMDKAADSSACWGVGNGKGDGYSLAVVVAVVVAVAGVGSCEMSAHSISPWLGLDSVDNAADSSTGKGEGKGMGTDDFALGSLKRRRREDQTHLAILKNGVRPSAVTHATIPKSGASSLRW